MKRPIEEVFDFVISPANPAFDRFSLTAPLDSTSIARSEFRLLGQEMNMTLSVVDYFRPNQLEYKTEIDDPKFGKKPAATMSFELASLGESTRIIQRLQQPLPSLGMLPLLPIMWLATKSGEVERLKKMKATLES